MKIKHDVLRQLNIIFNFIDHRSTQMLNPAYLHETQYEAIGMSYNAENDTVSFQYNWVPKGTNTETARGRELFTPLPTNKDEFSNLFTEVNEWIEMCIDFDRWVDFCD